jgi:hypothetical protein
MKTWMPLSSVMAGAALWVSTTQLGLILPALDCVRRSRWTLSLNLAAFFATIAIALLLGLAIPRSNAPVKPAGIVVALGTVLVFAFAIMLQGAASVLLNACQH